MSRAGLAGGRGSVMLEVFQRGRPMNEPEWLSRTDLREMTAFLRYRGSERKCRLFTVACARAIWDRVPPGEMRRTVEVAEAAADDPAYYRALSDLSWVLHAYRDKNAAIEQMSWASGSAERQSVYFHCVMTTLGYRDTTKLTEYPWHETRLLTGALQPNLFREIFGNPFRPIDFGPWRTDTVVALGRQIYASRDFSAMPILADALQDAGCDAEDVLNHCRDPKQLHVRGCCVLDSILGKG